MTIEEKARAYDEALNRCKEWASGTWGHSVDDSPKDIAEFIFPQLAESEDERIRKTLIEELSACNTVGELKFRLPAPTREECIAWLEKQKEQKPIVMHTPRYAPPEQKPAEWSEEDRLHYTNVLGALEYVKGCKSDYDKIEAVKSDIDWLKSIRPSWKPSEDEVRLINTSISFLKDFADKGYENAVECIDWLKSKLNGNSGK